MVHHGKIRPPGDKSLTQRALLFGALADGISTVRSPLRSGDTASMIGALRTLGVEIREEDQHIVVSGKGRNGLLTPDKDIDCGNSGTASRLLIGALAGHPFQSRLVGDDSLSARPMRRVTEPLGLMGARFAEESGDGLPLVIHGRALKRLDDFVSPKSSAQVKTALLLAGYVGGVSVTLRESPRSRDHTERMFRSLGQELSSDEDGTVRFLPTTDLNPFDVTIPGDISSAAFLIAATIMSQRDEITIEGVGYNPTRTGMISVIERMGASVEVVSQYEQLGEPVADLMTRASVLTGVRVAPEEIPSLIDEIPILAVLAARAHGETTFEGVGELKFKESDRFGLLAENLQNIGVEARAENDTLTVMGSKRGLAGHIQTGRDHRMAMAFSVLGRLPDVDLTFSETASSSVSYPGFFEHLDSVS